MSVTSEGGRGWNYFMQPEYEMHEEDLLKLVNIKQPNTLSTNKPAISDDYGGVNLHHTYDDNIQLSTTTYNMPKFDVGDIVALIDPITKHSVHGKILSEWDFRHGNVAPTIVRGENSLVWYVIETFENVEVSDQKPMSRTSTPPSVEFPKLKGLFHNDLHDEDGLAKELECKVREMRELEAYGPRRHFHSHASSTDAALSSSLSVEKQPIALKRDVFDNSYGTSNDGFGVSPMTSQKDWSSAPKIKVASRHATKRRLIDAVGLTAVAPNALGDADLQRCLNIVVMPENALFRPGDQHRLILSERYDYIREVLQLQLTAVIERREMRRALGIWKWFVMTIREIHRQAAAVKIQTLARVWNCRNMIPELLSKIDEELTEKWREQRKRLNIAPKDGPWRVTSDERVHFRTITNINRYYKIVRKVLLQLIAKLERQRVDVLQSGFRKWQSFSAAVLEARIRQGHWDLDYFDTETQRGSGDLKSAVGTKEAAVFSRLRLALEHGEQLDDKGVAMVDDEYNNVAALPLALTRDKSADAKYVAPPAKPSVGVALYTLPSIPAEQGPDGSPLVSAGNRPKFNSYRKLMSGPIDCACWVIPGKLLMGGAPFGVGKKSGWKSDSIITTAKDPISLLTLAGIGSLVSLLTVKEEELLEVRNQSSPIADILQPTAVVVKKALKDQVFFLKSQRDSEQTRLDHMQQLNPDLPGYERALKDRKKKKAKIAYTMMALDKGFIELNKFPSEFSWARYELQPETTITKHELLPIVWAVESMLANGECVYVYSRDGLDRAPLVCGCILGRMYGLSHIETLFRLQVHLNSAPNQIAAEIPVTCPQLPSHRALLEQVLRDSDRVYESVNLRSQIDPETYLTRVGPRQKVKVVRTLKDKRKHPPPESDPIIEYRLHRGLYENHDVYEEQVLTAPLEKGTGDPVTVFYPGGPLCEDFCKDSDSLVCDISEPTLKPTLPLIRRMKEKP